MRTNFLHFISELQEKERGGQIVNMTILSIAAFEDNQQAEAIVKSYLENLNGIDDEALLRTLVKSKRLELIQKFM